MTSKLLKMSRESVFFWAFFIFCTAFSFLINWYRAGYSDISWLLHGAQILLDGGNFSEHFFETNPPFNTAFYIPAALIQSATALNIHHASLLYLIPLTALVCVSTLINVRKIPLFGTDQYVFLSLSCLYMYFSLITSSIQIGQRDIFAGMGCFLVISTLMQYPQIISYPSYRSNPWNWFCISLGTVLTLLKPHWGALIILCMIHRAYKQKRLTIVFDYDFLLLAFICGLYAYLSLTLYPDFFIYVFPHVINIYVSDGILSALSTVMAHVFLFGALIGMMIIFKHEWNIPNRRKKQLQVIFIAALMSLIPPALQMKGFAYHFYVAYYFIAVAIIVMLYEGLRTLIGKKRLSKYIASITCILFLAYLTLINVAGIPYPSDYLKTKLAVSIQTHSEPGDSYFINKQNMGYVFPLNQLLDREYGSRFASFWFLGGYSDDRPEEERIKNREVFADIIGRDIAYYKPEIYVFQDFYHNPKSKEDIFDPVAHFSASPIFRKEWAHYKLVDVIKMKRQRKLFFLPEDIHKNKIVTFRVYKRFDEQDEPVYTYEDKASVRSEPTDD